MDDAVIKVDNISKKFCKTLKHSMFYGISDITKNMLGMSSRSEKLRTNEFWALDDISFEVKKGETLGIIGLNGSGKSTILKLLNGIFWPDKGKISIRGRVGALIEVGAGFHPLLTGRENIYLNAAILGMKKNEIDQKINSIIEFAEIGDFIDSPVKHYSSGMFVRLGFAIAIHCQPDILLIDEILSVGDLSFSNKSLRYMKDFRDKANAVVFVSHNMEHIRNICDKIIVLNNGKIRFYGEPESGLLLYQSVSREKKINKPQDVSEFIGHVDKEKTILSASGILDGNMQPANSVEIDDIFYHFVDFELLIDQSELIFSSGILDEKGNVIIHKISNDSEKWKFTNIKKGKYRLLFKYTANYLMPGIYHLSHGIRNQNTYETFQRITYGGKFIVHSDKEFTRGLINMPCEFILLNK